MRIVFMGANLTGWLCLNELLTMGAKVVGIFTIPRRFDISYSLQPVEVATYRSFDDLARKYQIPLVTITGQIGDHIGTLQEFEPDVVMVSGWYYMIPSKMLQVPPLGIIGFHPSLLPKYRGGAPLTWAIINDEAQTGMTMFYFNEGVDSGDTIAQSRVSIGENDTIATLYDKVNQATLLMIREIVPQLEKGRAPRHPQDESLATYFPQRSPADGLIDWSWPTRMIFNWIRAQTDPYPGAYTYVSGQKLTVWAGRLLDRPNNRVPGMLGCAIRIHRGQGVEVLTGDGSLLLTEVELKGRRAPADQLLTVGTRLGCNNDNIAATLAQSAGEVKR